MKTESNDVATPPAVAEPYQTAIEHLDDEVILVACLVQRQVVVARELGLAEARDEATRVATATSPAEDTSDTLAIFDAQIAEREACIARRLAASCAASTPLPLLGLVEALRLAAYRRRHQRSRGGAHRSRAGHWDRNP